MQVTDEMVRVALHEYVMGHHDTPEQAMRAALEAALAVMWRPMSEAPKDGTWILVFESSSIETQFHVVSWGLPEYSFEPRPETWVTISLGPNPDNYQVTDAACWMPLPSPPAEVT